MLVKLVLDRDRPSATPATECPPCILLRSTRLLAQPATFWEARATRERDIQDMNDTCEGVPGTRGGTSETIFQAGATYQEHLPSKPTVDAREVPAIEQLEQFDAKIGDPSTKLCPALIPSSCRQSLVVRTVTSHTRQARV
jgi:hypothetical protein